MKRHLTAISRGHWPVQAMRKRLANPTRCVLCVAGLTIALLGHNSAIAGEHSGVSSIICAKREILLTILVEAHGEFPNAASHKLAAESVALMQARTACDNGHARDTVEFYDRLISELTASLAARNK